MTYLKVYTMCVFRIETHNGITEMKGVHAGPLSVARLKRDVESVVPCNNTKTEKPSALRHL